MMKVIATQKGFYGNKLVKAGEVFEVNATESALWFTPVQAGAQAGVQKGGGVKSAGKTTPQTARKTAPPKTL